MSIAPDSYASLRAAARYVQCFRERIFVLKLGGDVLEDPAVRREICEQLNVLWRFSIRLVIVHGGGGRIDALCDLLGLPVKKIDGRRITTPDVLEAVKMGLAGAAHTDMLAAMQCAGLPVVGLSGVDAGLIKARRRAPVKNSDGGKCVDYGCVGDIELVNTGLLEHLLDGGYVPLVTPLSSDTDGNVLNINADTVASDIAVALCAEKLFFLLNVPGIMESLDDPTSLVPYSTLEELGKLESSGKISTGMRPKLAATRRALEGGVASVHFVSGLTPDAVLAEVFTNQGSGTMIISSEEPTEEWST